MTLGLQSGISIRSLAGAGDWLALFAKPALDDYVSVRVVAWALVTTENGEAFGAIVPAHDVDDNGADLLFAPAHPRFMCYLGPGQLLSDQFVRERLARIRQQQGG